MARRRQKQKALWKDLKTGTLSKHLSHLTPKDAILGRITARQLRVRLLDTKFLNYAKRNGFDVKTLRHLGFKLFDLQKAFFSPKEIKDGGYTAHDFSNALKPVEMMLEVGFSKRDILKTKPPVYELRHTRFSIKQLLLSGYSLRDLVMGGYKINDIYSLLPYKMRNKIAYDELIESRKSYDILRKFKDINNPREALVERIRKECSVRDLKHLGMDFDTILLYGYPLREIMSEFHKDAFRARGIGVNRLIRSGVYSMQDVKDAYPLLSFKDLAINTTQDLEFWRLGANFTDVGARDIPALLKEKHLTARKATKQISRMLKDYKP